MNTFLACIGVAGVWLCGFILADVHSELVRIRKALTKKNKITNNVVIRKWEPQEIDGSGGEPQGREHAP